MTNEKNPSNTDKNSGAAINSRAAINSGADKNGCGSKCGDKCKNVGKVDRNIRIVIGISVIAAGVYFQSYWGAIGLVALGTAFMGFCPAYLPFKITTCKK